MLEKLKSGEALNAKEQTIHTHGLVAVLKQLHDELDVAVLDAYGWSDLAPLMQLVNGNACAPEGKTRDDCKRELDEELLQRLVALNHERAQEEQRGLIRWLRPEFQNPTAASQKNAKEVVDQIAMPVEEGDDMVVAAAIKRAWPKDDIEQVKAVAEVLVNARRPISVDDVAAQFSGRGA